jgi:Fe2+ transport system protein FeoA
MEFAIMNTLFKGRAKAGKVKRTEMIQPDNLSKAKVNCPYTIKGINTNDKKMIDFLFTLGCFEGEKVTVISVLAENFIICVKDARYCIDKDLAQAILI